MKQKKDYTIIALAIPFVLACLFNLPGCYKTEKKQPVKVSYFRSGDLLLPDYACPDTLIIVDGKGLSDAMGLIEQGFIDATDYEIDSTIHQYAVIYTAKSGLQPENFESLVIHQ